MHLIKEKNVYLSMAMAYCNQIEKNSSCNDGKHCKKDAKKKRAQKAK